MTTNTEARAHLEAESDDDLRGIIASCSDSYLPVSASTRAALDWNAATAGEILAERAAVLSEAH